MFSSSCPISCRRRTTRRTPYKTIIPYFAVLLASDLHGSLLSGLALSVTKKGNGSPHVPVASIRSPLEQGNNKCTAPPGNIMDQIYGNHNGSASMESMSTDIGCASPASSASSHWLGEDHGPESGSVVGVDGEIDGIHIPNSPISAGHGAVDTLELESGKVFLGRGSEEVEKIQVEPELEGGRISGEKAPRNSTEEAVSHESSVSAVGGTKSEGDKDNAGDAFLVVGGVMGGKKLFRFWI